MQNICSNMCETCNRETLVLHRQIIHTLLLVMLIDAVLIQS